MCKSWCELIIAVVVIVFSLWQIPNVSQWILLVAGVLLLIHSFTCKTCFAGHSGMRKR